MKGRASGISFSDSHVTLPEVTAEDFARHRHTHSLHTDDHLLFYFKSFLVRTVSEKTGCTS